MTTLVDVRLLLTIFLATLPMLGAIAWNVVQIRSIRIVLERNRLFILDQQPEHPVVEP